MDENLGPEPLEIDPNNPAGALKASSGPSLAQRIETHMQSSPYAAGDSRGDPFLAGFHEALAHLRTLFPHL